jgi:hypothetical protein
VPQFDWQCLRSIGNGQPRRDLRHGDQKAVGFPQRRLQRPSTPREPQNFRRDRQRFTNGQSRSHRTNSGASPLRRHNKLATPQIPIPQVQPGPSATDMTQLEIDTRPRAEGNQHRTAMPSTGGKPAGLRVGNPPGGRNDDDVHAVKQGSGHGGQIGSRAWDQCKPGHGDTQLRRGHNPQSRHADHPRPRPAGRGLCEQHKQQGDRSADRHRAAAPQATPRKEPGHCLTNRQNPFPVDRCQGQAAGHAHPVGHDRGLQRRRSRHC